MINTTIDFLNSIHLDGEAIVVCLPLVLGYVIGILQPRIHWAFAKIRWEIKRRILWNKMKDQIKPWSALDEEEL